MSRPIRVLLVEDNPGDADLTKETLEDCRLHVEIDIAIDGAEALDRLFRRPPHGSAELPDLIFLDLNLPKMSGREVLAQIKQHPSLRTIPVVILTSSDGEQDVVRSYELGANCYVTKPVGLEAFQAIVRSVEGFWFTVVKLP
ncbi:MAG: response regulator [Burkholderiales bacterium]|nr:response regulator [Burkholderiales bacterium]